MKSALPSAIALGVLIFSAAGAQAHRLPGQGFHKDCRYGPAYEEALAPRWHRHGGVGWTASGFYWCEAPKGWVAPGKIDRTKPVVAPRCAARPRNKCAYTTEWTCANWYAPLKCCTRWQCTSKVH
jgi:hypothetical protein